MMAFSRRDFMRMSGGMAVATGGAAFLGACAPVRPIAGGAGTAQGGAATAAAPAETGFVPDLEIDLRAVPGVVQVLPGAPTQVWRYEASVLVGDPESVVALANTYLGPLIRVRRGQRVRVRFHNQLPEPSIVHWHGLLVPSRMDGHPRDAVGPGATYVYEFEVVNRAGTYWFHPHPEPLTGSQVIKGLAGIFVVTDDEEQALVLPSGAQDIPLVIQDRTFDANNQFVYVQGGEMAAMPGMASMEMLMGFLGDRILVNGAPDAALPVATRAYRLRLLNGSNSRVYKLAWSDGTPVTVLAAPAAVCWSGPWSDRS